MSGAPERLTTGTAQESRPDVVPAGAPGSWRMVFTSGTRTSTLWRQPLDANSGKLRGDPVRLISGRQRQSSPSASADGSKLAYVVRTLEASVLRLRNLSTGAEQTLTKLPDDFRARISPDGSQVAFNPTGQLEREAVIRLVPTEGGEVRELCNSCGLIYDWTPDSRKLNYRVGHPIRYESIDIQSGVKTVVLSDPKFDFHAAKYSPDGRWIALHYSPGNGPRGIFLAPLRDGKAAPSSDWVRIMDRPGRHSRPWWAPDGNSLYFLSSASGETEIWRQRLNSASRQPIGEPEVALPARGDNLIMTTGHQFGPGEGRDFFIFPFDEYTGNIWLAE